MNFVTIWQLPGLEERY